MALRNLAGVGALAIGLCTAAPAQASEKRDFETCDGRIHPGRQDDGMRGEPSSPSYQRALAFRGNTIAACTRALASTRLLPTQTLRRAHLLRARAAAYLQGGDNAKALTDLDLAQSTIIDRAGDPFTRRSMGVSLDLLRAVAYAQDGNVTRALPLALSAMALRPYSSQVQLLGAEIVHSLGDAKPAGQTHWAMAMRLDPDAAAAVLLREAEIGNFAAVLALRPSVIVNWPAQAPAGLSLLGHDAGATALMSALLVSFHTAYANAAAGDSALARQQVAEIRSRLQALRAPATKTSATGLPDLATFLEDAVAAKAKQVDARIAVAEGRHGDAIAAMVGAQLPKDAATVELITALKASAPAEDAAMVPDPAAFAIDAQKRRRESLGKMVVHALFAPETPRAVVDYERARPNILGALVGGALTMGTSLLGGINRTDGFRSSVLADGTTKVEFIGNTPSAVLVQEMTLLRAAELARAAGKPAFVIVDRKNYARTMKTMQYGVEISSRSTGYKTELTVRFVDSADQSPRAFEALAIIDALGPLYYEEKRAQS